MSSFSNQIGVNRGHGGDGGLRYYCSIISYSCSSTYTVIYVKKVWVGMMMMMMMMMAIIGGPE